MLGVLGGPLSARDCLGCESEGIRFTEGLVPRLHLPLDSSVSDVAGNLLSSKALRHAEALASCNSPLSSFFGKLRKLPEFAAE